MLTTIFYVFSFCLRLLGAVKEKITQNIMYKQDDAMLMTCRPHWISKWYIISPLLLVLCTLWPKTFKMALNKSLRNNNIMSTNVYPRWNRKYNVCIRWSNYMYILYIFDDIHTMALMLSSYSKHVSLKFVFKYT